MDSNIYQNGASRPLLNVISQFEADFSIDWLTALTEIKPSHILADLEKGINNNWLIKTGPGLFSFSDLRKKEQIAADLTDAEKETLNRKIANFFLHELPNGDQEAIILSRYLLHETNQEAGCRRLLRAGDAFNREFHPGKALRCYEKIQDDLIKRTSVEACDLYIDMAIKYSKISTGRQNTVKVIGILEEGLQRAEKRGNNAAEGILEMHLATNHWLRYEYRTAFKHFNSGWAKARKFGDKRLISSAVNFSTFFHYWQGRFNDVVRVYEEAVSDIDKLPRSDFPLLATSTVGFCYAITGQVTQGLGMVDALRVACLERGDTFYARACSATIGDILMLSLSKDEALKYFLYTYEESEQRHDDYANLLCKEALAYIYYLNGDIEQSVAFLGKYIQNCRELNISILHHKPYLLELYGAMVEEKYPRVFNISPEKEIERLTKSKNVYLKGLSYRFSAKIQIQNKQSNDEILETLNLSENWLIESGHILEIARTRIQKARRYLISGDEKQAREITLKVASDVSKFNVEDIISGDLRALIKDMTTHESLLKEILQLGQEIVTIRDSKDLVQRIISTVNRITGAERGAIFLLDENVKPSHLKLRASKNLTSEQVSHPDFESSLKMIEKIACATPDQATYFIASDESGKSISGSSIEMIRSRICIPMIFKDKVVGVLYHDNRLLNCDFKESDIELLSFFASQAAIALDNAIAYEEIQNLNRRLQKENLYYEEQQQPDGHFKNIVGESASIKQMQAQIEQVAGTESTVIILGETGVGKELVANAIHYHSARQTKPFIKANCSALTGTLINSELFGHERGAFTGANTQHIGRFELADTGTIFLDEIGDLPLDVQVNLLRVIQNKEYERVGGNQTIRSDFRLVVATNRDLEKLVKEKIFRADLFYRLNVFPIIVPPLRKRKEDIPLLTHFFVKRFSERMGKNISRVPSDDLMKLVQYNWPGNIRELENIIERGVIVSKGSTFKTPELGAGKTAPGSRSSGHTLEENERNHILWALEQTNWKVRGAGGTAEFLNINESTLSTRMKKLGIKRPPKYARKKS
jgi:formate hydrogenlyase transcriptional activator